ncbi:hypothetical protein [Herbidospora cretacea]|uniref:hypothetical protein n=1 Tax=Herbidospora cretacea TaxID=28444 RepID=UPI0004C3DA92|nr:hypothetical protein [Herbidospora cretacea]
MSHVPTPLIIDTATIEELARGDVGLIKLLQSYDAIGQPLVVPVLAMTGVASALPGDADAQALLGGLARLNHVMVASLNGVDQAVMLAKVMNRTGLAPWDAHVAAIADASVCPILTVSAAKWEGPSAALDNPLHIVEIADPDE